MPSRPLSRRYPYIVAVLLAAALVACGGASAFQGARSSAPEQKQHPAASAQKLSSLPPGWVKRVQEMPPAEQEKFLKNSARFRNLPPERRAEIRRRLQKWNKLTPQQRQAVLNRQRIWMQLTKEQKSYIRKTLLPQWRSLSIDRRQILLQKLHALRNLDDAHRAAMLSDESFLVGLSPEERQMLSDLSNLRVAGPATTSD